MFRSQFSFSAALLLLAGLATVASAQHRQKHLLVIGVPEQVNSQQEAATTLSARLFAETLSIHNGVSQQHGHPVTLLTGGADLGNVTPTKQNILQALRRMLREVEPQDEVWFYFCGHGLIADGQSNLVPIDALGFSLDNQSPKPKLLSVREVVSAIEACPAARKVLVLDCCQTDLSTQLAPDWSPSDQSGKWLGDLNSPSVEILASCDDGQSSLIWPSKKRALYTWWLCHGLRGAADANRDGQLSLNELATFSSQRVGQAMSIVKAEICRRANISPARAPVHLFDQAPQYRQAHAHLADEPTFVLRQTNFELAINTLAALTNDLVLLEAATWKENAPPTVAVGEFLESNGQTEELRGENGLFGKLAGDRLTSTLVEVRSDRYVVMQPAEVAKYLLDISVRARHEPESWTQAASDYFLDTTFTVAKQRRAIHVTSSLFDCRSGAQLNAMSSVISVNRELESVLGHSIVWPTPAIPQPSEAVASAQTNMANGSDQTVKPAAVSQPRQSKHLPSAAVTRSIPKLRIQLELSPRKNHAVRFASTQGSAIFGETGNSDIPKLRVFRGDNLQIRLKNLSRTERVAIVPMIDGTTVLKKQSGLTPEECVQRNLYYIMEPGAENLLDGWMTKKARANSQGAVAYQSDAFKVVAAPESIAAQNRYGRNLGEVRVVAYPVKVASKSAGRSAAVGIGAGVAKQHSLVPVVNWVADPTAGQTVYVIRYVSAQN